VLKNLLVTRGRYLLTAGGDDETAALWDAQTGDLVTRMTEHTTRVQAVAFFPTPAVF
jgi:WD40 repeat protein